MQIRITICAILLAGLLAFGQTYGEFTGRVSDASGAAVPAAIITLASVSTGAVRTTTSTDSGNYSFPAVPPGMYNLKTEHTGFKAATSLNVEVQVQQTVRLDFTLQVGQISESIEVQASAEQLQSENATVGTVIENRGIVELPLNGREYLNLVALSPNTNTLSPASGQAGSRQGGDRANQSISAAGQRIMYDYFTLDGVSNTDPNFNTYVVLPSIDALQEFKVQTGVYPAEFGHEATQINVLTKSGGNGYHAALFEFLATMFWTPSRTHLPINLRPNPRSSGTTMDSRWMVPCESPSFLTDRTSSSLWLTTRRSGEGRASRVSTRSRPPRCSRATSAMSKPPSTIPLPKRRFKETSSQRIASILSLKSCFSTTRPRTCPAPRW
jgi:hypothetical protein